MKTSAKLFLSAFAVIIGAIFLFLYTDLGSMCQNEIISQIPIGSSPKKVVVFERDCGATTGFSTQVSILGLGKELGSGAGNILILDDNHGKAPSSKGGGLEVVVNTISNKKVKILFDKRVRVFKKVPQFKGVTIEYGNL